MLCSAVEQKKRKKRKPCKLQTDLKAPIILLHKQWQNLKK